METFHRVQAKLKVAAVALTTTFLMLNCAVAHTPTPLYLYKPYLVLVPLSLALGSSSVLFFFWQLSGGSTFGVFCICLALHTKAEPSSILETKRCRNMRDPSLLLSLEPVAQKLAACGHVCKQTP